MADPFSGFQSAKWGIKQLLKEYEEIDITDYPDKVDELIQQHLEQMIPNLVRDIEALEEEDNGS